MIVFDDVLSGLDSTTMNHVMHALFGKAGLLRQSKTTVLLATHAGMDSYFRSSLTTHLSFSVNVLKYADHIIALSSDGRISEQGSFSELRFQHEGYVERLCKATDYANNDGQDGYDGIVPTPESRTQARPRQSTRISFLESRREARQSNRISLARQSTRISFLESGTAAQQGVAVTLPNIANARLDVPGADAPNRQMGDRKAYRHYFRATGVRNTVIFFLAEIFFVAFEIAPQVWLSRWADATGTDSYQGAGFYLGIYAALQVGFLVSLFIGARHVASTMVVRSGRWLHAQLVRTVSTAPLSFFTSTDAGITLNRFSQDVNLLDTELPVSLLLLGAAALGTLAQAVVVLVAAKYVGAAIALVVVVFYLVQRCYLRTSRQLRYLDLEAKSPLYSLFLEALRGRATVRAFRWQDECEAEFLSALDDSQRPAYLLASVQQWLALVLGLITAAVAVILVALMVTLKEKGTTTAGLGGVALLNMMSLSQNLMHAVVMWTRLETSIGAVARIKDFAEQTPAEVMSREAVELPKDWPTTGAVEFNDVAISYK
jgi:ATP-binding cassette subfamily C (CFTR/MRP) protein 1